jgi:hypothetical protein
MCRAGFLSSQLTPREVVATPDTLEVWSLEPMLRELKVTNCRTIRRTNIFKKWSMSHIKWFWSTFANVRKNWNYRVIFLHLTKATVHYILQATDLQVLQALENFGIVPPSDDSERNRRELLFTVLSELSSRK